MTTCANQSTTHPSSLLSSHEGTPKHSHALDECCNIRSSVVHVAAPNAGGQPKVHTQPTAGTLPRRVRGVRMVPKFIRELVRIHPHLDLSEFQSANGAGFFVPAKRSRRRIPVRSRTLNERRGVTLFIRFAPPNSGGSQGPTVGNLPRRRKATVVPQAQPVLDTATSPDDTKNKVFFASEESKAVV